MGERNKHEIGREKEKNTRWIKKWFSQKVVYEDKAGILEVDLLREFRTPGIILNIWNQSAKEDFFFSSKRSFSLDSLINVSFNL